MIGDPIGAPEGTTFSNKTSVDPTNSWEEWLGFEWSPCDGIHSFHNTCEMVGETPTHRKAPVASEIKVWVIKNDKGEFLTWSSSDTLWKWGIKVYRAEIIDNENGAKLFLKDLISDLTAPELLTMIDLSTAKPVRCTITIDEEE